MSKSLLLGAALLMTVSGASYARDYSVAGSHVEIGAEEQVDDLSIAGGTVEVHAPVQGDVSMIAGGAVLRGEVSGDVSVIAGKVDIYSHVKGDVTAIAGTVVLHEGAKVDGEVTGGRILNDNGALVEGTPGSSKWKLNLNSGKDNNPSHALTWRERVYSALFATVLFAIFGGLLRSVGPRLSKRIADKAAGPHVALWRDGVVLTILTTLLMIGMTVTIVGIPAVCCLLFGIAMALPAICFVHGVGYAELWLGKRIPQAFVLRLIVAVILGAMTQVPFGGLFFAVFGFIAVGAAWNAWRERKTQPVAVGSEMVISK